MIFNVPIKKYEEANSYQKRDCFKQLDEYLNTDRSTASHYIDTAISDNITNTFFNKNLPQEFIHRYDKLIGLHSQLPTT
jgi:hypothetical protein